jgi:hypothetical protein
LSSTVFHGKIDFVYCWNTNIISERGPAIGSLLRLTVPAVGSDSPAMMCSNVDLPQPDGPIKAMNSPSPTEKLMSRNARRLCDVNRFSRPSTSRVSVIGNRGAAFLVGKAIASGLLNFMGLGMWNVLAQSRSSHDGHGTACGTSLTRYPTAVCGQPARANP